MNELSILDSFFNDVLGNADTNVFYTAGTTPRVDVKEDDKSYTLEMELPGRSEKDVNIELEHDTLSISSVTEEKTEKKSDKEDSKEKYILRERRVSSFSRRFTLPKDVNAEAISANFKNGILTINMEKKAVEAPKKIMIEAC